MKRFFTLFVLFLSSIATISAQVEKPYFQVFDISDDTKSIKIETGDSYKIRKWNGVQLMVDMSIRLEGGSMDLLGAIIFDNRYAYESVPQGANLLVRAKMNRRDLFARADKDAVIWRIERHSAALDPRRPALEVSCRQATQAEADRKSVV